jgi:hypothetical protein
VSVLERAGHQKHGAYNPARQSTSVVAANVEGAPRTPRHFGIDLCVQDAFLALEWTGSHGPSRFDYDGVPIIDPLRRRKQPIVMGKVARNVCPLHCGSRGKRQAIDEPPKSILL